MELKRIILNFSLFFVLLSCHGQNAETADKSRSNNNLHQIESKIDQLVKEYQSLDIFSGVILVADHGNPTYHKAFGMANRSEKTPNTLNTKFDIGSMNKTFTKVVILKLYEEGRLNFEDNIGQYLSGLTTESSTKVTINQLLNHTSGYGDYLTYEYDELPANEKTFHKTFERVKGSPLEFEPGTDQMYSNIGYILLGAIIEKISGKSYFDNVHEYIIKPMGLNNTSMKSKREAKKLTIGYYRTVDGKIIANDRLLELPKPDGGFRSTALDIIKFYSEFHYGNKILKKETKMKDEFFSAIQAHANTGGAIPHAGGYPGANTVKYEILRDKVSILVFANMDEPVAEQLGAGILAIVRGQEPEKPSFPAVPNIYKEYNKHGIDYVKNNFEDLTKNFHPTDPRGLILNQVGYFYLNKRKSPDDAIKLFTLNTELFGNEDPNVWDSLGEAYYTKGQKKKALEIYNKALEIDPEFPPSLQMVEKIKKEL